MEFFKRWFQGFGEGLEALSEEERGRLFRPCAAMCAKDALAQLYEGLFLECQQDLDLFFSRLHTVKGVDGAVIRPGQEYELRFLSCECDLHTRAKLSTPSLCECSRQSILCELKTLLPAQAFTVTATQTILQGAENCCFRIVKR